MAVVFEKTKGLTDAKLHYCPGCGHGIVHRLVAEVLEEMGAVDKAIGVCPVGCAVLAGNYLACDMVDLFIDTPFEGGRHQARVDDLNALDRK